MDLASCCLLLPLFVPAGALAKPDVEQSSAPGRRAQTASTITISTDLSPEAFFYAYEEVEFEITVRDPDGGRVSLTLLNPVPGLSFEPIHQASSPATSRARWLVSPGSEGREELLFEAWDADCEGRRTRLSLGVRVDAYFVAQLSRGDVTGDGILDVVGVSDTGRTIQVFAGGDVDGSSEPIAVLVSETPGDRLRLIDLADVTGDGIQDVVLSTPGVGIFLYPGGSSLLSGSSMEDVLPWSSLPPGEVQIAEVTGDTTLDIVVLGTTGGGAFPNTIFVFEGGAGLAGLPTPKATLGAAGVVPSADHALNPDLSWASGVHLHDFSGDGILDVLAVAPKAEVDGVPSAGAVYLWRGGPSLSGSLEPTVTWSVPGASPSDQLGLGPRPFRIGDVTGDGQEDLVVVAYLADVNGVQDAGAIHVFSFDGGGLGSQGPLASVAVPDALPGIIFGANGPLGPEPSFELGDVTGDGVLDIVASGGGVYGPGGAIHVAPGGPGLSGDVSPRARFISPSMFTDLYPQPFTDVTGDGIADVLAYSALLGISGTVLAVYGGGPDLSGMTLPTAVLYVPNAHYDDVLGQNLPGFGTVRYRGRYPVVRTADVTGDGFLDVLALSALGIPERQALHVFAGGESLVGRVSPRANLYIPGGPYRGPVAGPPYRLAELDGDGVLDVLITSPTAQLGRAPAVGAVFAYRGGESLRGDRAPSATFVAPVARAKDHLGDTVFGNEGVQVVDYLQDGQVELVVSASFAASPIEGNRPVSQAGAAYLFCCGDLEGTVAPRRIFAVPGALPGTNLGNASRYIQGFQLADLTGDSRLDLVGGSAASAFYLFAAESVAGTLGFPFPLNFAPR